MKKKFYLFIISCIDGWDIASCHTEMFIYSKTKKNNSTDFIPNLTNCKQINKKKLFVRNIFSSSYSACFKNLFNVVYVVIQSEHDHKQQLNPTTLSYTRVSVWNK